MKISKLIKEITTIAENKFGISAHTCDTINVTCFYQLSNGKEIWQVFLCSPSAAELKKRDASNFNVSDYMGKTDACDYVTAFLIEKPTLISALKELLSQVRNCNPNDYYHFISSVRKVVGR